MPCKAKRTCHAWDPTCTPGPDDPTSSWHPLRATSLYAVGKTNWRRVSSNSLGLACLCRIPLLRTRWFYSHPNWLTSGASVALDWLFPSIPSLSLVITRLRMGLLLGLDASPARVMLATWLLSWSMCRMCRSLLEASMGLADTWRAASCTACTAAAVTLMCSVCIVRHASWPGYPQQGVWHLYWLCHPYSAA